MIYNVFKSIQRSPSPIDLFMILISKKIRYLYIFVLIFMWFRNDSYKKTTCDALQSAGVALVVFANAVLKVDVDFITLLTGAGRPHNSEATRLSAAPAYSEVPFVQIDIKV